MVIIMIPAAELKRPLRYIVLMTYRALGRTGWKVSEVSFGAWAIGGAWGSVSDGESMAALHKAIDCGVNFIDTADVYGMGCSERLIAQLKRERTGLLPARNFRGPGRTSAIAPPSVSSRKDERVPAGQRNVQRKTLSPFALVAAAGHAPTAA